MLRTMSEFERELRSKVAEAGETLKQAVEAGHEETAVPALAEAI